VLAMAARSAKERHFRLGWSLWRRTHQAVAARCKKASRAAREVLHREESLEECTALKVSVLSAEGSAEGGALTDAEWKMVKPLLPQRPPTGRRYNDHRTVLGGILWVARTGSSWREMPEEEFGKWQTAYRRYELWVKQGLWQRILGALGEEVLPGPATK
jgi:Putative transposase of IS4/5 family (DUF4096)